MLTNTERQQIVEEVNAGTYGIDEALDDIAAAQKGEEVRKALYAEAIVLNKEGKAGSTDMIARQQVANLQTSVNGQISTLRTEVGEDIDDLETALNSGLATQNGKIAAQNATIANVVANYNVEYGSTELWASTGETGALAAGTTVTLSEDVSHFDYIDIYSFCGNANVLDTVPVDAKLQSNAGYALRWVNLSDPGSGTYEAYVRIIETKIKIIGTTLTIVHQVAYRNGSSVTISGAEITQSNRSTYVGELGIMKVVGRKITANTEIEDVRIGADGTEYASAGQAVRAQVNDLKSAIPVIDATLSVADRPAGAKAVGDAIQAARDAASEALASAIAVERVTATEVQNARVGADGVTYDTLGEAIRGQVTDLKSALDDSVADLKEDLLHSKILTEIDTNEWSSGLYYNTTNGNASSLGGASASPRLPCSEYDSISITVQGYGDTRGVVFYGSTTIPSSFISGVAYDSGTKTYTVDIPSNAKFVGITGPVVNAYFIKSVEPKEVYNELFDEPSITWTSGKYYNSWGTLSNFTWTSYSNKIPLGNYKKAILKVQGHSDNRSLQYFDSNQAFIQAMPYTDGVNVYELEFPSNACYIGLTKDNDDTYFSFKFCNIGDALEVGSIAKKYTEYEPSIDWFDGRYWNGNNGNLSTFGGTSASPLTRLHGTKKILLAVWGWNDPRGLAFFKKDGTYISGVTYAQGNNSYEIDVPSDAYFVGITKNNDYSIYIRFLGQSLQSISNKYSFADVSSLVSMFTKIGFCGDSYTKSQIYNESGVSLGYWEKSGYPAVMGRYYGITPSVFAIGGATTETWLTDSHCLPLALSSDPQQLYLLCLGINDKTYVTKGTIADIKSDYTQNPNTFYGNYGRIIEQLMNHAPNAKFIIVKSFIPVSDFGMVMGYYDYSSIPCEEIAEHYGFPYLETMDSDFFASPEWANGRWGGHPTAPLYAGLAKELGRLIGKCIYENYEYFGDFMIP